MTDEPQEQSAVGTRTAGYEQADVVRVMDAIVATDPEWQRELLIDFGDKQWRPDLAKSEKSVLHVHLSDRLRPYIVKRLLATRELGYESHLAMPLSALYDDELLRGIAGADCHVHLVTVDDESVTVDAKSPERLLMSLARQQLHLAPEIRETLGTAGWELSQDPGVSGQTRGARFESLVVFLLSQVEDFRVIETNLRVDTEELDAVVQQSKTEGRCWSMLGAPFILVEAKNRKTPTTQPDVSVFRIKMQGKRGSVRIGFLISASDFTADARDQEMKFASDDLTITLVERSHILDWIKADDVNQYVEDLVRRAMLR